MDKNSTQYYCTPERYPNESFEEYKLRRKQTARGIKSLTQTLTICRVHYSDMQIKRDPKERLGVEKEIYDFTLARTDTSIAPLPELPTL